MTTYYSSLPVFPRTKNLTRRQLCLITQLGPVRATSP